MTESKLFSELCLSLVASLGKSSGRSMMSKFSSVTETDSVGEVGVVGGAGSGSVMFLGENGSATDSFFPREAAKGGGGRAGFLNW